MCRFLVQTEYDGSEEQLSKFKEALLLMKNGGPDHTGILIYDGILFGHNRLSIIDLSDEANQPFETERSILVFNGEIYNYKDLKSKFDLQCNTDSDTEVIIKIYEKFGLTGLSYLEGEYSYVLYDKNDKTFIRSTDPSGVKPLYCTGEFDRKCIYSSQPDAILSLLNDFPYSSLDIIRMNHFLHFGTFSDTPFPMIYRIKGGKIYESNRETLGPIVDSEYYPIDPSPITLRNNIENIIKSRMQSDVPIACALSGGMDSAIIAYVMSKNSKEPIKTYTIGVDGLDNEFEEARQTAEWLGTDHHEIHLTMDEIIDNIDEIITTMGDPSDRGSLIPTYFLAKNVKEKVILSGEGADEIFGGYKRYQKALTDEFDVYTECYEVFNHDEIKDQYRSNFREGINPQQMMTFDQHNELPHYHCQRLDRCFMRFGIECRVPFLHGSLVKSMAKISIKDHISPPKRILKNAFHGVIPDYILYRKKKPFKLPYEYLLEREEVKQNILETDNQFIKKESIIDIYNSSPESRNRSRKLWTIYLLNKWTALQKR